MATNSAVRPSGAPGAHGSVAAASGAEGARRVLAVLQAFSPRHHTLTARDLAESTGIPLPSMYRYIALLRETGLLVGDERGAYHLSARLISLARAAEAAESIIEVADPVMRDLVRECGETVILVQLVARVPVCVHRVESAHHFRATFEPGSSCRSTAAPAGGCCSPGCRRSCGATTWRRSRRRTRRRPRAWSASPRRRLSAAGR